MFENKATVYKYMYTHTHRCMRIYICVYYIHYTIYMCVYIYIIYTHTYICNFSFLFHLTLYGVFSHIFSHGHSLRLSCHFLHTKQETAGEPALRTS